MKRRVAVVATRRAAEVAAHLSGWEIREALTTDGVLRTRGDAALVVLDSDLAEGKLSRAGLLETLERAGVTVVSAAEFLAAPETFRTAAAAGRGRGLAVTPLRVAFASVSGGVGKTTLAGHLARWIAHQGGSVALVEIVWGVGLLAGMPNGHHPDLYQVAMGLRPPARHEGVTTVPADPAGMKLLLGSPERVRDTVRALARDHALLVLDVHAAHPLWPAVREEMDRILVVADPRPEAIANARALLDEAGARGALVLNRASLADRIAASLSGADFPLLVIPDGARDIGARLAKFLGVVR